LILFYFNIADILSINLTLKILELQQVPKTSMTGEGDWCMPALLPFQDEVSMTFPWHHGSNVLLYEITTAIPWVMLISDMSAYRPASITAGSLTGTCLYPARPNGLMQVSTRFRGAAAERWMICGACSNYCQSTGSASMTILRHPNASVLLGGVYQTKQELQDSVVVNILFMLIYSSL